MCFQHSTHFSTARRRSCRRRSCLSV